MTQAQRIALGAIPLALAYSAAVFAGFLAPYDPTEQNRATPFSPPALLGGAGWPAIRWMVRDAGGTLRLFGTRDGGRFFLLGSDAFGRDQFSRILYGARITLAAGPLAAALSLAIGWLFGAIAGYCGGLADDLIMRAAELFVALPWLYLLFAVRAFLPLHVRPETAFLLVVAVVGCVGWARPARLVRGIVLSAKERPYVIAARGFGAGSAYLLRRHILPQTAGVTLTQAALLIPRYTAAEVTLSFLGLGVGEPVPSWGNMLAAVQHYYVLVSYWWMLLPGLLLAPLYLSYIVLADALMDGGNTVTE